MTFSFKSLAILLITALLIVLWVAIIVSVVCWRRQKTAGVVQTYVFEPKLLCPIHIAETNVFCRVQLSGSVNLP